MSALIRSLILTTLFLINAPLLLAQERILDYQVEIVVTSNAEVEVTETILVNAEGFKIKRGIFRDFPTRYRDYFGHRYNVGFDILDITRDGSREPYHTKNMSNGVRIYIGDKDTYLSRGQYRYKLKFRTDRQLGFFEDHDELYFNAIGHSWDFPIEQASVNVRLPETVPHDSIRVDGYTGVMGSTAKDFTSNIRPYENTVDFRTTRRLLPGQGFTVVVGWAKGAIAPPSFNQKLRYFLRDNFDVLVGLLGLACTFIYYLVAWHYAGRDPRKGAIFPQWEIPKNLTPSETRYIHEMAFDKKVFVSQLIDLAVRGVIRIEQTKLSGGYDLIKLDTDRPLSATESEVIARLFRSGKRIEIDNQNHSRLSSAISALENALESKHLRKSFYSNLEFLIPGIIITLLTYFLILKNANFDTAALISLGNFIVAFLFLALHFTFRFLLKAPTIWGRKVMDGIEGVKMYMTMAERGTMAAVKDINEAPQFFEKLLPYAFALDVENEWCEKFAATFDKLKEQGNEYSPVWYRNPHRRGLHLANFGQAFAKDFSSSIASSSKPPGSSSGFSSGGGGGGFSGGGGGGGGGGGW